MASIDIISQDTALASQDLATCSYCKESCVDTDIIVGEEHFCCHGCQSVWEILHESDLASFYTLLEDRPGSMRWKKSSDFDFLMDPAIEDRLVKFGTSEQATLFLDLPQIHCVACVWLLERLPKLLPGVQYCRVDFGKKRARIGYSRLETSLYDIALLLDKIGYKASFAHENIQDDHQAQKPVNRRLVYQIGLAGFCFGNTMLLSFPDYLGYEANDAFRYLVLGKIALAAPVVFYSAGDFLKEAYRSIRYRNISLDVPIAIGLMALFTQSCVELITGSGPGYFDSMIGFVFFLLIGRWFQQKTYSHIRFDRDYSSFFPISVLRRSEEDWSNVTLAELRVGDEILVKQDQVVPCDGYLTSEQTKIDFSFVTGESDPIYIRRG